MNIITWKRLCTAIAIMMAVSIGLAAQNKEYMKEITSTELYNAFVNDSSTAGELYGMQTMLITGVAVKVGPDVYGLPSVEVAGSADETCKALCVLPFSDYLKLRHVSKKDKVVIEGEVRGYTSEYDLVVVKKCRIIEVNGKIL